MPKDVPDWTAQTKANLVGGLSGLDLGDVGAPQLQTDSATETITTSGGPIIDGSAVLASFKAAAASVIAQVGALGAVAQGSNTSVSPAFGQAPTAGSLLVAWVTSATGEPTTAQAGWVKAVSKQASSMWAAIWVKPNAAGADAAPTFTAAAGSTTMHAQLGEFSGAATAAPTDQTSSATTNNGTSLVPVNAAPDVAFGDLALLCSRWALTNPATATFSETFNNGGAVVHAGDTGGTTFQRQSSFAYTIIPAATVSQPLGVADWAYDVTGTAAPASSSTASVVLAATPGKTYTAAQLSATQSDQAAVTAREEDLVLKDGTTVLATLGLAVGAVAGGFASYAQSGLAYKGTTGNSMTWAFTSAGASIFYRVNIGAYLR